MGERALTIVSGIFAVVLHVNFLALQAVVDLAEKFFYFIGFWDNIAKAGEVKIINVFINGYRCKG